MPIIWVGSTEPSRARQMNILLRFRAVKMPSIKYEAVKCCFVQRLHKYDWLLIMKFKLKMPAVIIYESGLPISKSKTYWSDNVS